MKRDLLLSTLLHVCIIAATFVTSPFETSRQVDYGETIRVSLSAMPQFSAPEPESVTPLEIPQALESEPAEIPIDDPATQPEAEIEESVPESKPEPKTKKPYQPQTPEGDQNRAGAAEGEIEASSTSGGSPFAGAYVDNASFNKYPYWYDQAFNKILRSWNNPVVSDGAIICVVYFQVIKSGRMIESRVEKSSGIPAFDDACIGALKRADPFPPLPRDFREEIIGITLPFKYEPR